MSATISPADRMKVELSYVTVFSPYSLQWLPQPTNSLVTFIIVTKPFHIQNT